MSQEINLINATPPRHAFSPTSVNAMLLAGSMAAALMACLGVYEHLHLKKVEAEAQVLQRSLKEVRDVNDKLAAAKQAKAPGSGADAKLVELEQQLKGRQQIMDALKSGAVGSTAGFSEYMLAFSRQSIKGLWLTGFDVASGGNELTISGRALSADLVPVYLERLNREAPLQGRGFSSMQISQAPVPAATGSPADATRGDPQPLLRPYVEFTISSGGQAEGSKAATAVTPMAPSPRDTRKPELAK